MKDWIKNLKIGKKLMAAFAIIIILYSITMITAGTNIKSLAKKHGRLVQWSLRQR